MAFTEFTCRSGGNNLNAGTLDGVSEAATAPIATFTGGDWNGGTLYTAPVGSDLTAVAAALAAGELWASVYNDGDLTPTASQYTSRRVLAVNVGARTITVSSSNQINFVAPPSIGAGNRSCRVGGAWKGPNGAEKFPIGLVNFSAANAAGNRPRVNLKNDQTYTATATWVEGLAGAFAVYEGYANTFGDGGFTTCTGGTSGASFTVLSFSSANPEIEWRYVKFQNNGATGNVSMVSGGGPTFYRCRFMDCRGFGFECNSTFPSATLVECEGSGANQANAIINGSGGSPFGANSSGGVTLVRCYSHDNNAGANCHGFVGGGTSFIDNCIFANNGGTGATVSGAKARVRHCTFYFNGSHGVNVGGGLGTLVTGNVIIRNGGFGVSGGDMRATENAFWLNTSGDYSTLVTGTKTAIDLTGDPFVNAAGGDYRLNNTPGAGAACRAAAAGTFLVNGVVTTIGFPDVGAAQHQEAADYPTVGNVRLAVVYASGTLTGTLVLPPVDKVTSGYNYGAGGVEFTGTAPSASPPTFIAAAGTGQAVSIPARAASVMIQGGVP